MNDEKTLQKNEQDIIVQKQLEWVTSFSLDELRKTLGDSRYLIFIGNALHIFAAISLFIALAVYYGELMWANEKSFSDSKPSLIWLTILVASYSIPIILKKININRRIIMFSNLFPVVIGIVALYYFILMTCHSPVGSYCLYLSGRGEIPHKPSVRVISDALKLVFWYLVSVPVLESSAVMLQRSRSKASRFFLIASAVIFAASGVIAFFAAELKLITTLIFFFLMPGVIWIAARNRNGLFGDHALSHSQLKLVLKQKERGENSVIIPEDSKDISNKKNYLSAAWVGLAVFVIYLLYIVIGQ